MTVRINNGKDSYLYCNIDDNAALYADRYDSAEECFNDYKSDITEECTQRGYSEAETKTVLSHYEIRFNNYNGEWRDCYAD